ncbi:FAD-dependent oxidoreductase [Sphingobacterium sp. SGG-5]|uniref:FAD-dependent oxidoreductase n=1 Tax=Sphingobacterium sp. SGG-5 TaxID=2710881 RepID=UPI0013EABF54|nr:FAD-dependent oxidoreductase [Sphingobacterium sp. SGG-5]NGM62139.1 FAD-dependent oxidoreductase [Sphingobacterium sp. SGG-5]
MKDNRRNFLKAIGLGTSAFFINPVAAYQGNVEKKKLVDVIDNEDTYITRKMETDVVVAGGGMSGVCAAIAAARNGAKVVLIQNRSRLGGNASSEVRMHISGATVLRQVWRETGILEELMLEEAVVNQQKSYEILDYVLYDKVMSEPNITLLFDASVYDATARGRTITHVKAYCSQTEELYEVQGKYFVDCTGDGTLAALVGAEFMIGREARSKWNESLGHEKPDDITMGNSLLFMAEEYDKPMPFKAPSWARKYTLKDFQHRKITSWEYGYWWLELGGMEDIIKDGQKIRHDLMAVLFGVWDYIKNSGNHPESENWALSWFGAIPGKRESRRITGDYIMTQKDIQSPEKLYDGVAYGGWALDDHLPLGMDDTAAKPFRAVPLKGPYPIPMRSLYSKSFDNLLMAGRNMSGSHIALSSTRVMATCAAMGQAVGTAANYCINKNITPAALCAEGDNIKEFRQILLRQDQPILHVVNTDDKDLARKASVKASSETEKGKAIRVIDGINRDIQDGQVHQWQAEMGDVSPWVELRWKDAVSLNQIEFTFDTGLHRFLRISGEAVVLKGQVRGPQPETISDFLIDVLHKGKSVYKNLIKGNYLRKFVHQLPEKITADAVRITVQKTNGDKLARIFEIRCYA